MAGVNRVFLMGNLGADPEIKNTSSGSFVTNLRLATSETWNDTRTGERQERTEWHNVVLFGRLAEVASEYLRKGSRVYIDGKVQTRKWQDQQGQDRYTTEVLGKALEIIDSATAGSSNIGRRGSPTNDEATSNRPIDSSSSRKDPGSDRVPF